MIIQYLQILPSNRVQNRIFYNIRTRLLASAYKMAMLLVKGRRCIQLTSKYCLTSVHFTLLVSLLVVSLQLPFLPLVITVRRSLCFVSLFSTCHFHLSCLAVMSSCHVQVPLLQLVFATRTRPSFFVLESSFLFVPVTLTFYFVFSVVTCYWKNVLESSCTMSEIVLELCGSSQNCVKKIAGNWWKLLASIAKPSQHVLRSYAMPLALRAL